MARIKKNLTKSTRCPRCKKKVHRGDIQEYCSGEQVDELAYCQHCGNYWIANRRAKDKVMR